MCGIYCSLQYRESKSPTQNMLDGLRQRGPNSCRTLQRTAQGLKCQVYLSFTTTVLALRGDKVVSQPATTEEAESLLCWNGEAWKLGGVPITLNDTEILFRGLLECTKQKTNMRNTEDEQPDHIERFIASISGPFAFVFYDAQAARIYYGRDGTGRRSLMACPDESGGITLSSISDKSISGVWSEVTSDGIYSFDLRSITEASAECSSFPAPRQTRWDTLQKNDILCAQIIPRVNNALPSSPSKTSDVSVIYQLQRQLLRSLHLRLKGIPRLHNRDTAEARNIASTLGYSPDEKNPELDQPINVLFSGGLDCTVLARLTHELMPLATPIALVNVAFENPRLGRAHKPESGVSPVSTSIYESCPDRITARASFSELQRVCPGRSWLFISVNIPYHETLSHRDHIRALMHPHDTEMDLSIATALYFACRGCGSIETRTGLQQYTTRSHVFLSGLGADELFAGYLRHENAYRTGGLQRLVLELQLDIGRIGQRNLGRDDRVTTNWAREVRYPYLDEELIRWTMKLPVWQKCTFGLESDRVSNGHAQGLEAGKHLLRQLAVRLGLAQVAREKKRAIQFGSRSAKMLNRKTKGTEHVRAI